MKQILQNTLYPACAPGNYAIIDYPNYLNPGDCAIWLGTRAFLEWVYGAPPVYISTIRNFNSRRCRRLLGEGTVFFLGGGNFGSTYAKHNKYRLDIIRSLPDCRLVVLPVSVAGLIDGDSKNIDETQEVIGTHKNLTLFARDVSSQNVLSNFLDRPIELCPDLAHAFDLDPLPPMGGVTYLLRKDIETNLAEPVETQSGIKTWDWPDLPALKAWNKAGKLLNSFPQYQIRRHFQDLVARRKAEIALRPLIKSDVVVTDRLHGFLLAHALGRKVIILDNSTGKVASYWKTWRSNFSNVLLAKNQMEAIDLSHQ